ncbi:GD25572 [Drosophila simulans]|uniref:GD25572 n=1 Tax=Drosophila simulans TaxID=7240 RepID=B4QHE6_DROSI|nr:GD25572 [Drosophila simulans]
MFLFSADMPQSSLAPAHQLVLSYPSTVILATRRSLGELSRLLSIIKEIRIAEKRLKQRAWANSRSISGGIGLGFGSGLVIGRKGLRLFVRPVSEAES